MELHKDSNLKKMFTVALLIIALLADHCEAGNCYTCAEPHPSYDNCANGIPTSSQAPTQAPCRTDTCAKVTLSGGGRTIVTKGCFGIEACTGISSGCKTYSLEEYVQGEQKCNYPRNGNFNEGKGKQSANSSESRQDASSITYEVCVCSGELCNTGAVSLKMTTTVMMILMINIAIAATSLI